MKEVIIYRVLVDLTDMVWNERKCFERVNI